MFLPWNSFDLMDIFWGLTVLFDMLFNFFRFAEIDLQRNLPIKIIIKYVPVI